MKTKTLILSAIICGASILGINFSAAHAATSSQIEKINPNIEIEQKSRYGNSPSGGILIIQTIEKNKHKDKNKHNYRHENYQRHDRHHTPPPPHHRPHR